MNRILLRIFALILMPALLISFALVASSGMSLARDIAYYEVTSSSYDQAAGVPFVVTVAARDAIHDLVRDNTTTLTISSNSHSMVFDSNNNGIFGETSDSTGVLSYGRLHIHAKDTVVARGAIITVTDSNANEGSSDAYAISPTTVVSADGWAWQNPLPQGNNLRGISGRSSGDIFAVGEAGTIMHYNGVAWTPMHSGTVNKLYAVSATTSSDAFAVGDDGVMHYDGVAWTIVRGGNSLRDVWGVSPSNVFAVGDGGVFIRYDGTTWTQVSSDTTSNLYGVWGSSSSEVFAVGENGTLLHYEYGGVTWTSVTGSYTLRGVWGTSSSDIFAVGDAGTVLHYDGATWTAMSSGTGSNLWGIWGSSSSDAFAVGDGGTILHYDGTTWTAISSGTTNKLDGVWGSPTGDIVVVGSGGVILHRADDHWLPMSSGAGEDLKAIWGSSPSDVFAAGDGGAVLHYDGSGWTAMDTGTTATLLGIWGSSSSDVFAVGYVPEGGGVILHYDGGTWSTMFGPDVTLGGVWGSSPADVFVVGDLGSILHYDGNAWTAMNSGATTWLDDVWGTSASDVFAVGTEGVILHYDGTTWTAMNSGVTTWLGGVAGTSSSDVLAVGGGTVLHFDGSTWSEMVGNGPSQCDVWVSPTSDFFVVGDSGVFHYDGSVWTEMNKAARGITYGVWGISSSDILAVGAAGAILHYQEPVPIIMNTVTPSSGELGETLDVIINGSNLKGATALTFGLGVAVTVNSFTAETPSQITASITIAPDAAVGARNVYVFTDNGEGRLYSGFMANEAAPPPSPPQKAARSWLLGLWILLGILGAGVLGVLAFFLSRRLRKRLKPAKLEPLEPEVVEQAKPERKVQRFQTLEPVITEKPISKAVPVESISLAALKAVLDGGGRYKGTGHAATGETSASDQENAADEKPVLKNGQSGSPPKKGRKINRPEGPGTAK